MKFVMQQARFLTLVLVISISLGAPSGIAAPTFVGPAEIIDADEWLKGDRHKGGKVDLMEYFTRTETKRPKKKLTSEEQAYEFFDIYNELAENGDLPIGVYFVVAGFGEAYSNEAAIAASGVDKDTFYFYIGVARKVFREHLGY